MAVQISAENLPEPDKGLDPQFVAGVFVKQYYGILEKSPGIVHKFYTDQSVIDRPGPDGEMTSVTTMQDISETIMSSDYKGCLAEILNADAQESVDGGVIVAVNGYFIGKDSLRKSFYQTFFLARQERGFFVLNDMLRFMDAHGTFTPAAGSETDKSSLSVHLTHTPETVDIAGHPEPTNACAVEDDTKKLSDAKDSQSSDAPIQNEVPTMKTSYASMVAKQIKVTSPTRTSASMVVRVAPTADQHPKASPILKSPIVPSDGATKDFNSSNNSTENSSFNGDDVATRSVYVGNLPSNLTKSGLLDAVKVFGRVRQGSIQLRTYEDGFCFGLVEFESAASARNAIEARNIPIGKNDAYITYKRSFARSSNNNGGFRGGHFKVRDNGEGHGNNGVTTQGYHQSDTGRFSRLNGESNPNGGFGRESYRRNDARWSNGEGYQRNNQRRFGSE